MTGPERYAFGEFVLERAQQRVLRADGTALALTPRLFDALLHFVERPGQLLDKDGLIDALWPGLVVEENNLSQVVHNLRRALGDDGNRFIQTVPRRGFRFIAPVTPLAAAGDLPATPARPGASLSRRRRVVLAAGALGCGLAASAVAWWAVARRPGAPGAAGVITLAVLPFKALGAAPADELLGIGMAESIVQRLSPVSGLVVRSVSSVERYRGGPNDPVRVAQDLDVQWVVDGSLQRSGDRLRATARLLRVQDGIAAWSGTFDERTADVFDLQDQIARRVAQELAPTLRAAGPAREPVAAGGTRSIEAYQLYLIAAWAKQQGRPDAIAKSIALLHQALDIDPQFAIAWAHLAWSHRYKLWHTDDTAASIFEPANLAVQRALAIVPELSQGLAGLAFSHYWWDFDWPAAEREFRAALAANPNEVSAHRGLGLLLATQGRVEAGLAHTRTARELDPMSASSNVIEASYLIDAGRLPEARVRLERGLDLAPNFWLAHDCRARLYFAERNDTAGLASLREAMLLAVGTVRPKALLALALARTGRLDEARTLRNELVALSQLRYIPPTSVAMAHAAVGDKDGALTSLELALAVRDVRMIFLKDDPAWRSLRGEPRFEALMAKLKLTGLPPGLTPV